MTSQALWVNGRRVEVEAGPGEMLSDILRYRLGLTGTKIACDEAECGTCTVLMDGEPVLSCTIPAAQAAERRLVTIAGLAPAAPLPPRPAAFVPYGAIQCGFCIRGQLMTAAALLEREPDPTESQIPEARKASGSGGR